MVYKGYYYHDLGFRVPLEGYFQGPRADARRLYESGFNAGSPLGVLFPGLVLRLALFSYPYWTAKFPNPKP